MKLLNHRFQTTEDIKFLYQETSRNYEQESNKIDSKENTQESNESIVFDPERIKAEIGSLEQSKANLEQGLVQARAEKQRLMLISLASEKIMEMKLSPEWWDDDTFNYDGNHIDVNVNWQMSDEDLINSSELSEIGLSVEQATAILNDNENEVKEVSSDLDKCCEMKDRAFAMEDPEKALQKVNENLEYKRSLLQNKELETLPDYYSILQNVGSIEELQKYIDNRDDIATKEGVSVTELDKKTKSYFFNLGQNHGPMQNVGSMKEVEGYVKFRDFMTQNISGVTQAEMDKKTKSYILNLDQNHNSDQEWKNFVVENIAGVSMAELKW